jgi:hypothetical protein
MGLSGSEKLIYEKFKKEVVYLVLKSNDSNEKKKVIKWNNTIYQTNSIKQLFSIVKSQIKGK